MALLLKAKALLQHSPQLVELNYSSKRLAGHVAGFTAIDEALLESALPFERLEWFIHLFSNRIRACRVFHLMDTFAQFRHRELLLFNQYKLLSLYSVHLQLTTLRGSIMEDAVPSTAKHGMSRGLPLKEVLEYVVPEVNIQCLRMAISSPKVPEQLLKLDQQGVSTVLKGLQTILHTESVENVFDFKFFF